MFYFPTSSRSHFHAYRARCHIMLFLARHALLHSPLIILFLHVPGWRVIPYFGVTLDPKFCVLLSADSPRRLQAILATDDTNSLSSSNFAFLPSELACRLSWPTSLEKHTAVAPLPSQASQANQGLRPPPSALRRTGSFPCHWYSGDCICIW